tara:strand:- start:45438 stop:46550 length:1113 start_codon:yes stop_codon:yes gene_type:complete
MNTATTRQTPNRRLEILASRLTEIQVDAILVTNETNVGYLSGFTGDSSYLLVQPGRTAILTDGRYETQIAAECPQLETAIRPPGQGMLDLIKELLSGTDLGRIGFESAHVSVAEFAQLRQKCPNVEWVQTSGVVEDQRIIKDASEIEITRQAVRIAERTFQSVVAKLRPDWSEQEIAYELESTMRFLGASGVSFSPIVAAGPSGALPHYHSSPNPIGDAATLLIDWGAFYQGYASDITRTLHREHASDRFRRAYDAVLEAQLTAIQAIRPGAAAKDVDEAARQTLQKAGLGDAFKHGLGHGTGLEIHEAPRLSAISDETLQTGMIITVEPGVYFEGDFGIRIEDDVLVTETGHEVLSTLPKGLDECRMML